MQQILKLFKKTQFHTLKIKVNNLKKKTPDGTTLIHISQCKTDKHKGGGESDNPCFEGQVKLPTPCILQNPQAYQMKLTT